MNNRNIEEDRVAVAIDKDKGSQYALKWAVDNVLNKGQNVSLIHINNKHNHNGSATSEIFLPFRCFCTRKDIKCEEVIIEDSDIPRAIIEYAKANVIDTLVTGSSAKGGFVRKFKGPDVPTLVSKGAPEFTTVYVISKGKVMSVRSATRPAQNYPFPTPQHSPDSQTQASFTDSYNFNSSSSQDARNQFIPSLQKPEDNNMIKSPFTRGKGGNGRAYGDIGLMPESDISFVGSDKPRLDRLFSLDGVDFGQLPCPSPVGSDLDRTSFGSSAFSDMRLSMGRGSFTDSQCSGTNLSGFSASSTDYMDDVESEMKRLRLELDKTVEMYTAACKEAYLAKQKAKELEARKMEEDHALIGEETTTSIAEKEKQKCRAALEAAEAAQKIAQLESQKRINVEFKALKEAEVKKKEAGEHVSDDMMCRRYSIKEIEVATNNFSESLKIGEGGYGPVYKGTLDHTPVAIKILRTDASEGQEQFKQEVDILSCIRHPHMVILLGACPEHGCLVYEHMSNGSLEDRLFCRKNTPPLSWQARFRIAAEIGTALLFLHQTKPEPLVHRDLKPGNILLDQNLVSKISDVGLARLVPPSVADSVTQYRMTQTVGTFCYIDPEYQQTGMLGVKSDIYSLGVLFLQLITARPPMGLTHQVEKAIESGSLEDLLDPSVTNWPIEDTYRFVKLCLKCVELRRRDRPDLKVILPELIRLRALGEEAMFM